MDKIKFIIKLTMKKIRIKQIKSAIDRPERQKRTLRALGITKMNRPVEHEVTPQIEGMIKKILHLLAVEEI
jgi:large subunit ribosomal protein L30